MTSDLTKEIIVGSLSAFLTALFSGVPAAALFWWTYKRDQERLIVEKAGPRELETVRHASLKDRPNSVLEILVRNRSLFPVHVSAVGFEVDGEVITADYPDVPTLDQRHILEQGTDPWEIGSQASLRIKLSHSSDRNRFAEALVKAANRRDVSTEAILNSPRMIAIVATQTGKVFTSRSVIDSTYRWLLQIKKEMDD